MNAALGVTGTEVAWAADTTSGQAYYSVAEAAALLGVSRVTIWRWVRAGRLPIWRLGHRTARIKRENLERLLSERGSTSVAPRPADAAGTLALAPDGATGPGDDHIVQFYAADSVLVEAIAEYIGAGLRAGGAGIIIATEAHPAGGEDRVHPAGLDVVAAPAGGRAAP